MSVLRDLPEAQRKEAEKLIQKLDHDGLNEAEHERLMELLREAGWENSPGSIEDIDNTDYGSGGESEGKPDAPMGLDAEGIYHGKNPPSKTGWGQIEPGPRGGNRWQQTGTKRAAPPEQPNANLPTQREAAKPDAAGYSQPKGPIPPAPMPLPPLPGEVQQPATNQVATNQAAQAEPAQPAATVGGWQPQAQASPPAPPAPTTESEIPTNTTSTPQEEFLHHMRTAPATDMQPLGGGTNGSYTVNIGGVKSVWKPAEEEDLIQYIDRNTTREEIGDALRQVSDIIRNGGKPEIKQDPVRWGIKSGTFYQRETAAYSVAKAVGIEHLVPQTVTREVDGKTGSVMLWAHDGNPAASMRDEDAYNGPEDRGLAAAFDFLIGNTDRHDGNWMVASGLHPRREAGKLILIDHGLAFPNNGTEEFRSALFRRAKLNDEPVPQAILQWDANKVAAAMNENGIDQESAKGVLDRLAVLKKVAQDKESFNFVRPPRPPLPERPPKDELPTNRG